MVSQAGYDCRSVSLRAPIAVPVEIRAPKRRVFRLSAAVGEDGIRLARGTAFEPGRPVDVRFALPDGGGALALPAIVDAGDAPDDEIAFVDPPADAREAIRRYVHGRLGLPGAIA
jgi:PilZ domain-containing protein